MCIKFTLSETPSAGLPTTVKATEIKITPKNISINIFAQKSQNFKKVIISSTKPLKITVRFQETESRCVCTITVNIGELNKGLHTSFSISEYSITLSTATIVLSSSEVNLTNKLRI